MSEPEKRIAEKTVFESKAEKPTFFREIRNNFLSGVFVALPIALTIWLIGKFVIGVDNLIKPLIPAKINPESYLPLELPFGLSINTLPGFGLIVGFFLLFVLGTLAKNFFGRTILSLGERILNRVPIVGAVYNFIKQIVGVVAERQDANFSEVCMVEYPRKNVWVVAFITSDVAGAPAKVLPEGFSNVFVPTTPNPTSGFLLMVHRSEIKILDMTPEEGAKLIISAGMVTEEPVKPAPRVSNRKSRKSKG
ncbi:MAG: DUF502 domain-containing protein [Robiginitomaculum sp.]